MMTGLIVFEIFIVLLLFVANGVFAMSEMAVVSSRKSRLKQLAANGDPRAAAALRLAETPDRFLPTVQIGITLVGLLAGAFSGATLAEALATYLRTFPGIAGGAEAIAVTVVVLALTFLSLVIGELAPKRIALAAPEKIACRLARPVEWLSRAAQPAIRILSAATDLLLRTLRVTPAKREGVSEEELRLLLLEGSESGVFHKDEPRMVESVLAFDRLPIREIMTPREKLVFLSPTDTHETLWHKIVVSGHSSYPVQGEDRDHIIGTVSVKSMYANVAAGAPARVSDLLTPPLYVDPQEPILKVLDRFKRTGIHLAVVRDATGRTVGLVTLVDVLEAIVGDLPSLEDRLRPEARQRPDGSWLVDGQYDLGKLAGSLPGLSPLPLAESNITVAAWITARLAGAPREGDTVSSGGWRFEVIDMDRTSVDKVLIQSHTVQLPEPASFPEKRVA